MNVGQKLALSSTVRTISLLVQVIVGMLLMPFIIHSLGDRIYGYWVLVAAFLGYYGLLDLGIVTAVQYRVALLIGKQDDKEINRTISTAFFVFTICGVFIFIITIIAALLSPCIIADKVETKLFSTVLLIMGFGFAVGFPCRVFLGALAAHIRFDLISGTNMIGTLVRAIWIVILLKSGYGIVALALVTMLIELLLNVIQFLLLKKIRTTFRLSVRTASREVLRELFGYSIVTFIAKIADQVRFNVPPFIIGTFLGVATVTHYAIALRMTGYFRNLIIALIGGIAPMFSQKFGRKDEPAIRRTFIIGTKLSMIFSFFVGFCLLIYGKTFIALWMGIKYADAYLPLTLLVIGVMTELSQVASDGFLYGTARHRFCAVANVIEALSNIMLSICLVSRFGMLGVALGFAIPLSVIKIVAQPWYVCKSLKINLLDYYLKVFILGFCKIAIVFAISWWLFSHHLIGKGIVGLIPPIAVTGLCTLPISFFWVLKKDEREIIFKRFFARTP